MSVSNAERDRAAPCEHNEELQRKLDDLKMWRHKVYETLRDLDEFHHFCGVCHRDTKMCSCERCVLCQKTYHEDGLNGSDGTCVCYLCHQEPRSCLCRCRDCHRSIHHIQVPFSDGGWLSSGGCICQYHCCGMTFLPQSELDDYPLYPDGSENGHYFVNDPNHPESRDKVHYKFFEYRPNARDRERFPVDTIIAPKLNLCQRCERGYVYLPSKIWGLAPH